MAVFMDYTGKRVFHNKFGEGTIISQDNKGYISVQFEKEQELKKFCAPACFKQFLMLLDAAAAGKAAEENQRMDAENATTAAQRQRELQATVFARQMEARRSGGGDRSVHVPMYSSFSAFCEESEKELRAEIAFLKKNGGKRIKLIDGELVEAKNGRFIYSFESDSELNIPDNTQISLWPPSSQESIPGTLVNCEEFVVIIASTQDLGKTVAVIEFSAEPWRLLLFLIDRLLALRENPPSIAKALVCDGRKMIRPGKEIRKGQDTACEMSRSQNITFIWGPPGTGKTETLSRIALMHIKQGRRVLMLSYSNVSVDGAIWRVFNRDSSNEPGKLVRYGYPKDKNMLRHDFLTSYNLTLQNHPALKKERDELINERKHLSSNSLKYLENGKRLEQIRKQLADEEKQAVKNASFVATTVSKAIADSTLYEDRYDTVIFDEASMAYIPQIVFASSLAKKHFICMGDFAQLPPIVQSSNTCTLNADVFDYCGIVSAVNSGSGHEWLCLLDTQFRMHPEIADFASRTMYRGLLKSGEMMDNQRKPIIERPPFPGDALCLADLSGMLSVCTKTADQSRINVLSALISLGFAVIAATKNDVGVITPYNAQSRLLHAMSRDVAEQAPELHPISCATVHQFQGSEKDVIIYDAVDCYRMQYPGTLLSSTANNYANRLYNVALTRAKGKMISVVNVDYMKKKNLSKALVFRRMIDMLGARGKTISGDDVIYDMSSRIVDFFHPQPACDEFLHDLSLARKEVNIDIPGGTSGNSSWLQRFSQELMSAKKRGLRVFLRTDNKAAIPKEIRPFVIENKFIANPIAIIDKSITWYGMPFSDADFIAEGQKIPTLYKPILRFHGRHFSNALYGFLEMSKTVDSSNDQPDEDNCASYNSFSSYVAGEIKCSKCGAKMRLMKSRKGRFFLSCSNYPSCEFTQFIEPETVNDYFYFHNRKGKRCPRDNTSLEARVGQYGIYVHCNGIERHNYKLDEI